MSRLNDEYFAIFTSVFTRCIKGVHPILRLVRITGGRTKSMRYKRGALTFKASVFVAFVSIDRATRR